MSTIKVPITRPTLGDAEIAEVSRVIRSGWVTQGPEVATFETEFAKAVGAPFAVAVSNCTVALELALRAVGVGPGDDVVTVSHSFIATANAITTLGARPVFCDVEEDTWGMKAESLAACITPKTKAILCVHQIGMPCDLEPIAKVAAAHNIPLIEDAACAIGSEIKIKDRWERIGRPHGILACFSMHPRKIVTTGDGGMITTADENLAKRLKMWRQHAMNVPDTIRHYSDKVVFESYVEPAFNYRLTDLQAAIGRPQLAKLDAIVQERRRLADGYKAKLEGHPVLAPPVERAHLKSNWQSYATRMREGTRLTQTEILQFFMDRNIAAKRGIMNAHQEPAYNAELQKGLSSLPLHTGRWACGPSECVSQCAPGTCKRLSISEKMRDRTIVLPLFHGMTDEEQGAVFDALTALAAFAAK